MFHFWWWWFGVGTDNNALSLLLSILLNDVDYIFDKAFVTIFKNNLGRMFSHMLGLQG